MSFISRNESEEIQTEKRASTKKAMKTEEKSAWRNITQERLEFVVKWTRALNAWTRYLDLFPGPWRVTERIYRPRL